MKALPWIALVIGAGWLLVRQGTSHTLTTRITSLESRVVAAERTLHANATAQDSADPSHAAKAARDGRSAAETLPALSSIDDLDLDALAAAMASNQPGGVPNLKEMVRMQRFLLEADADELAALVERTGAMDVPDDIKRQMISQFVQILAQTDPQRALSLAFASPYMDANQNPWPFTSGFSGWIRKDPATALAWFDEQIAAGNFESKSLDGKSRARTQFEAAALGQLLGTDPAAARARLEAIPEKDRSDILGNGHLMKLGPDAEAGFAALVRESIPAEKQASAFAGVTRTLVNRGGYERVGKFMETIEATPAERAAIAAQAANSKFQQMGWQEHTPDAAEIAEMRGFAQEFAPDSANLITGEAMANLAHNEKKIESAVDIVRSMHTEDPNDDLLVGFLQQANVWQDRETASGLAELIEDPGRREAVLKKFEPQTP